MKRTATLLAALLLASPAFASSITMDMPNLEFPGDSVTVSTAGCPTADAQACPTTGRD